MRKGIGKGTGRGYKNMLGNDPRVHSMSAKGLKQPQRLNPIINQGFKDVDNFVEEIETSKKKGFIQRATDRVNQEREKLKQSKIKNQLEELKEVRRPEVQQIETQKIRIDELRYQKEKSRDDSQRERLAKELDEEERQYNKKIEKFTEINVEDFSDQELKTLAVRTRESDSIFSDMFGSKGNKYEKELLRRIAKTRELNKEINNAKRGIKPKKEAGFFSDFF